jgi:hypothetical protein
MTGTEVYFDTSELDTAEFDTAGEHLRLGCGL